MNRLLIGMVASTLLVALVALFVWFQERSYPATRIGNGVLCSRCKTGFVLPDASQAEPD
jgi:hypothetical protein